MEAPTCRTAATGDRGDAPLRRGGSKARARPRGRPEIGLVVVVLLAGGFVAHALAFQFTQDDAYISLRYAQNLVAGNGLVFNGGERVEGYSNFSWTLLLALFLKLGAPAVETSRWLGILFGVGAILAAARLAASLEGRWGLAAAATAALIAGNSAFALWSTGGLETALFVFLVTWGLERGLAPDLNERQRAAAPLLLCLAALTRPDGPLIFALWFILRGAAVVAPGEDTRRAPMRAPARRLLRDVALFAGPLVPYALWKLAYYGDLLPNTYYAKAGLSLAYVGRGLEYAGEYFHAYGMWGVTPVLAGVAFAIRGRRSVEAQLLFVWLGYAAYVVAIGGDVLYVHRFWLPTLPIGAVLVARGATAIGERLANLTRVRAACPAFTIVVTGSVIGVGLASNWGSIQERRQNETNFVRNMRTTGEWLREHLPPGSTIAITTIGAISYYSGLRVIDMLGLTDREIARDPRLVDGLSDNWREVKYNAESIIRRRPDAILFSTGIRPSSAAEKALYFYENFHEAYYHYYFRATPARVNVQVAFRLRDDAPPVHLDRVEAEGFEFVERYAQGIRVLSLERDSGRAAELFRRSHEVAPAGFRWAKEFWAASLYDDGKRDAALPMLREVVDSDSYSITAVERLAHHAVVEGDLESARALYERILAIDPDHDIPWRGLSEISRQQEDYEAAFQYLLDGLRRWDTNVNSLLAFGQLATRVRRYDLAEWAFLRARRIQPDSELAQLGLALVRESRNSPAESESAPPKAGSRR